MSTEYYDKTHTIGFTIYYKKNEMFILSYGNAHPFDYVYRVCNEIQARSHLMPQDRFNVYFDLSSVLGESASNKYFVITYDRNKKDFDYSTKKTLLELP